jgi:acylphosphatase
VQGVGFRYETLIKARRVGLKGIVRNEADGAVYIEAEGPEEGLNEFIEWCKKGPPGAAIRKITIEFQPALANFSDFVIEY